MANLLAAIPSAVALIQDGWENVLSVGVKTSSSVLLPVWSSKLEGRFKGKDTGKGADDIEMSEENGGKANGEKKKNKGAVKADIEQRRPKQEKSKVGITTYAEKNGKKEKRTLVEEAGEAFPVKKAKAVKAVSISDPTKAEKIAKKFGKKSSSLGSGGAGKRAKELAVGRKA